MVAPSEERATSISHKNEKKHSATKRPRRGTKKMSVYSVGGNSEGGGLIRPSMRRSFRRSFIVGGADDGPGEDGKYHMQRKEKWRILKNIAAISFAFMMQFTAFQGTANLQSSINSKDGLGTASLCGVYAALVISCIFIPTFLIKQFTVKWTLCLSMLCYAPYIGAQFYPRFYTLVPTGILLGLGAAPMWAAKATYLTQVGGIYAKLTDQAIDAIIVRFFGFFFLAWQTAELWGNLISSLVLSGGAHGGGGGGNHSADALDECGAHFCVGGAHNNDNLERPPDSEIFEISAIYLSCVVIASAMVALLVDPLSRYGEKQRGSVAGELTGWQLLAATFNQMKKPNQQMLIPLTVFIGLEQAFIGAEYTQAYVSCAIGIHKVGYVMVCFGVVNAICCLLFGSIMKYTGRAPLMALGAIVHAGIIVILLIWRPSPDHEWVFYGISGLWGIADSVWQTQMNGIYGTLFRRNKEAAFSNYRLWESFGFVIGYAYSTYLCAAMKLYIMMAVLILGVIGYISVELLRTKKIERRRTLAEDPKAAAAAAAELARQNKVEETDDEIDDVDDEIVVEENDDEEEDPEADVIREEDEEVPKQGTNL